MNRLFKSNIIAYALSALLLVTTSLVTFVGTLHVMELTSFDHMREVTYLVQTENGYGSGVLIAPNRILTAAHVVDGSTNITINGLETTIIRMDKDNDLALLYVELSCPKTILQIDSCAVLAKDRPDIDNSVYVVGYPIYPGFITQLLTEGRIQNYILGAEDKVKYLVTTAPVISGNSGGPVFVRTVFGYEVVGIVVQVAVLPTGFGVSFIPHINKSIPIDSIRKFLRIDSLKAKNL